MKFTVLFLLIGSFGLCSLTNTYIAAASVGANDGTSCANAHANTFFNSGANWGVGATQIGSDTFVHLCGTTTGTLSANALTFQGSGSSGHPVTLIFESGAVLTAPAWGTYNAAGAITATGVHDVVIDGNNTGTITATANGTGLANQVSSIGIFISTCTRCTVKNLTISNMYVPVVNNAGNTSSSTGIMSGTGNATLLITNNVIHDAYYCTFSVFNGDTNLEISANTLSHCNWGVGGGASAASATVSGFLVHDNDISDGGIWEDPADNNHHNGVYIFAEQVSSTVTGLQIYNNYIHGDFQLHVTGWIFVSCQTGSITDPLIFNNVLTSSTPGSIPSNGFIMAWVDNPSIYNNTIIGAATSGGNGIEVTSCSGSATGTIKNNIISTVATGIYAPAGTVLIASNNNDIFNLSANAMVNHSTFYASVAAWTAGTGYDATSQTGDPKVNANGTLQSGSPAIANGANLSSLGITALNSDKAGVARGSSWDIGAFNAPPSGGGSSSLGASKMLGAEVMH